MRGRLAAMTEPTLMIPYDAEVLSVMTPGIPYGTRKLRFTLGPLYKSRSVQRALVRLIRSGALTLVDGKAVWQVPTR